MHASQCGSCNCQFDSWQVFHLRGYSASDFHATSLWSPTLVCFFSWASTACLWRKACLQMLQEYGLTPVWIKLCILSALWVLNPFSHVLHLCGLLPVCVLRCRFKDCLDTQEYPQYSQLNSLSPCLCLMWLFKSLLQLKLFSHCWHFSTFSSWFLFLWSLKSLIAPNFLLHISHGYGLSPVWTHCSWRFSQDELWKPLEQNWQMNFLGSWHDFIWYLSCPVVLQE